MYGNFIRMNKHIFLCIIFKLALTGHASISDASVSLSDFCLSVSDSWGIGELHFNLSGTLIRLIYTGTASPQYKRMLLMRSILMMRMRKILMKEKFKVDDVNNIQVGL